MSSAAITGPSVLRVDPSQIEISGKNLFIHSSLALGSQRPIKTIIRFNPTRILIITEAGHLKGVEPYDVNLSPLLDQQALKALLSCGHKLGLSQMNNGDFRVYLKIALLGGGKLSIDPSKTPIPTVINKVRDLLKSYLFTEESTDDDDKYVWKVDKDDKKGPSITLELMIKPRKYETTLDLKSLEDQGSLGDELSQKLASSLSSAATEQTSKSSSKRAAKSSSKQADQEVSETKNQHTDTDAVFTAFEKKDRAFVDLIFKTNPWIGQAFSKEAILKESQEANWGKLELAAILGRIDIAESLLKHNISLLNQRRAILRIAAGYGGHLKFLIFLIKSDRSLLLENSSEGNTCLHLAAFFGHTACCDHIVECEPSLLRTVAYNGSTALHFCAWGGHSEKHLETARTFVRKDLSLLLVSNSDALSCLHTAAYYGHTEIAKFFIGQQRQLLQMKTKDGASPLHKAAEGGHIDFAIMLLKMESTLAQALDTGNSSYAHTAAENGQSDFAVWIYKNTPKEFARVNNNGETPLHSAARRGQLKLLQTFYEKDPTFLQFANDNGITLVSWAVAWGQKQLVQWIIGQDHSQLRTVDKKGYTLLHIAAKYNQSSIAQWLIEQEISLLDVLSLDGENPMILAAWFGHIEVAEVLVAKKKSLLKKAKKDKLKLTPMHLAVLNKKPLFINWLLEQDSSLRYNHDSRTYTPEKLAKEVAKECNDAAGFADVLAVFKNFKGK